MTAPRLHVVPDEERDPLDVLMEIYELAGGGRAGVAAVYRFLRLVAFEFVDAMGVERP